MNRTTSSLVAVAAALVSTSVPAAERTVTLAVEKMTCASCPYIVKQALTRVPGVKHAEVSFEQKSAVITFDDAKADVATLMKSTTDAGFPSHQVKQ